MSVVPSCFYHQAIRYQDQSKYNYYLFQIKLHVSILYMDHHLHQLDDDDYDDPCIGSKHVA